MTIMGNPGKSFAVTSGYVPKIHLEPLEIGSLTPEEITSYNACQVEETLTAIPFPSLGFA